MKIDLILGNCLEKLEDLPDNSIDSIVTDPPYHLVSIVKRFGKENSAPAKFGTDGAFSRASKGFMGKDWDGVNEEGIGIAQKVELWKECLRVLKPGGHLLAFSGTRTYHRMASAIEDAGFEIRDMIEWVYGSGFPKSLNIGKAVDKINGELGRKQKFTEWMRTTEITASEINKITDSFMGSHYLTAKEQPAIPTAEIWAILRPHIKTEIPQWVDDLVERIEREREIVGIQTNIANKNNDNTGRYNWNTENQERKESIDITKGTSEWEGWGTALKPAHEPICMARKPLGQQELDIAKNICYNITEKGLINNSEIIWRIKNVKSVEKQKTKESSSLTEQQRTVVVSAETVKMNENESVGKKIQKLIDSICESGIQETGNKPEKQVPKAISKTKTEYQDTGENINTNEKQKLLKHTEEGASVVENQDLSSSPLTILEVAEDSTEKKSKTETSMSSLKSTDTPKTDIDYFAQTATSQWVCMDIVRILKVSFEGKEYDFIELSDGSLVWNENLEPYRKQQKLNVAENCLKWGTGGINIDQSRVLTPDDEARKQKILAGEVVCNAFCDKHEFYPSSLDDILSFSQQQLLDFYQHIFSELGSYSISYTNLLHNLEGIDYKSCKQLLGVPYDCGRLAERVNEYVYGRQQSQGSQSDCPTLSRLYGECVRWNLDVAPDVFPLNDDVQNDILHYLNSKENSLLDNNPHLVFVLVFLAYSLLVNNNLHNHYTACKNKKQAGRFPSNLLHDNSEEVRECFPETKSGGGNKNSVNNQENSFLGTGFGGTGTKTDWKIDSGNASRFFKSIIYQAKASKSERNKGCEGLEEKQSVGGGGGIGDYLDDVNSASGKYGSEKAPAKNNHPTVKPIALMEYLIKMVTPKGGTVLDPFMGSGSTGVACKKLNRNFIGIELDADYMKIAQSRINSTPLSLL